MSLDSVVCQSTHSLKRHLSVRTEICIESGVGSLGSLPKSVSLKCVRWLKAACFHGLFGVFVRGLKLVPSVSSGGVNPARSMSEGYMLIDSVIALVEIPGCIWPG